MRLETVAIFIVKLITHKKKIYLSCSKFQLLWKKGKAKGIDATCQRKFTDCMQYIELLLQPDGEVTIKRNCSASKAFQNTTDSLGVLSLQQLSMSW